MKSTRVYIIVVLVLALIGTAGLAWRQHLELLNTRPTSKVTGKNMADMEKLVWDAEQRVRQLEADLANARSQAPAVAARGAEQAAQGGRGQNAQGGQGGRGGGQNPQQAIQQLMQQPAYQAAMAVQQRAQLDVQYAGLIRNLGLAPDQGDRLKALLMEKTQVQQDAALAAQTAGLDPRTQEYRDFINQAMAQSTDNIRTLLGPDGYTALQNYDATQNQRAVVNSFQQQLLQYGTSALLTDAQSEQLTQLLANSRGARGGDGGGDQIMALAGRGGAAVQTFIGAAGLGNIAAFGQQTISPNVLNQAQQILTPVQYQALQQMQASQQASQTLMQMTTSAIQQQNQQQRGGQQGGRGGAAAGGGGGGGGGARQGGR